MTYQPYPQQPDPNYGYQQPYQPYPQTYPQQQYPAYGPPPQPKAKSPVVIIIIVVVVILLIVVPIIIAGVLVVYMQSFSSGPGTTVATASLSPISFTNPYDGSGTTNGGGWAVRVISLAGTKPLLSGTKVSITLNSLTYTALTSVSSSTASLSYTAGTPQWYLKAHSALKFMDGTTAKTLDASTAKNLGPGEYETVQGAYFIYTDTDGDGHVSIGDIVYVYADNNGDGTQDISGSGYDLEMSTNGLTVGSSSLV